MSKILYYSTCAMMTPHIGVTIDDVISSKGKGDEIYWCYCHNALNSCFGNLNGYSSICHFCHSMYQCYGNKYGNGVHMIAIDKRNFIRNPHPWHFGSLEQIKSIVYRNVYVGYSILSLYLTYTRDLDIKPQHEFASFFKPIVDDICDFIDYVYDMIEKIKPDEIISFNGRLFDNRLFYDIANAVGVKYTSLEVVGGNGEPFKKVRFEGGLPHSISVNTNKILNLWETSALTDEKKVEVASSFYFRRRGGKLVADTAVYISAQKEGMLPAGFDSSRRNFVIFNSSEDESAAVGGEWEDSLFTSQFEAIEYLLKNSTPDIHYYLRIHPHLKDVKYKAHMELYTLSKYENLTIIPPESEVSTYSLMEACEKTITFGSTMGIEAVFWGKPSILLSRSLYENLDVCYQASCKEDIIPLLLKRLEPKPQLGALKYAYFLLDREYGVEKNIIDIDVRHRKVHWDFQFTSYFKIYGSQLLYQIFFFIHCILLLRFCKREQCFPG